MQYMGPQVLLYTPIQADAASQGSKFAKGFLPEMAQQRIEPMTIRLIAMSSSNIMLLNITFQRFDFSLLVRLKCWNFSNIMFVFLT